MNRMQLGVSPLSWMNSDLPQLGSDIPLTQCLEEASKIGYRGIELEDPFRKILGTLPSLLEDNRLQMVAGWHSTFLIQNSLAMEKERLKQHMDVLDRLGANIVNLAECTAAVHREEKPLSSRPRVAEGSWSRLCDGLEALAEMLLDEGFFSAYHHHMGTLIQDGKDIDRLMQGTRKLGLLFDSGHLLYAQEDPLEVLKKHVSRVTHVHCKNVRSSVLMENLAFDRPFSSAIVGGVFTVPGDMSDYQEPFVIDFEAIIQALIVDGYQGWVIVEAEQDPKKAEPYKYAKMGYEYLTRLLDPAMIK
jgi:inosose dehydratase